ncbi:ankyrin repeats (3 copies) domain-containing protein [Pochonia chlamydosporia 170]|uniref:Ankyrin repeats (3 copies) domain-containing protein n=1 Tax=Pochonia chlamydosporia 170 TaxID=1380566 RepID=A0A179FCU1_METCM|nr:ankyrin repeats (3 copies) domain-containing protein [Pochonia chlamydosporia 170]OAQ62919.2 ankyrin repeats (3 copies) domain-containing protein [Pochonia chlamydosporia 170]
MSFVDVNAAGEQIVLVLEKLAQITADPPCAAQPPPVQPRKCSSARFLGQALIVAGMGLENLGQDVIWG